MQCSFMTHAWLVSDLQDDKGDAAESGFNMNVKRVNDRGLNIKKSLKLVVDAANLQYL